VLKANQNPLELPSGIYATFTRAKLFRGRPSWHVTCSHSFKNKLMAAKIRAFKLLQEIRGYAEIANRFPPPRLPGLFLIQMRSHAIQPAPPIRRLSIVMEDQDRPDIPHPVRINHLKPNPHLAATLPAA
jgi:hypothetical protein